MTITRFLAKYEYIRTIKLFRECFGDDEAFINELYGQIDGKNECTGTIKDHTVAVIENEKGEILSMVHYKFVNAAYAGGQMKAAYIMDVATRPDCRRNGYMDTLMKLVISVLEAKKIPWCFLVAVNKDIYRHLGFVYDWVFNPEEAPLLDADPGLIECSARLIRAESFIPPAGLGNITLKQQQNI